MRPPCADFAFGCNPHRPARNTQESAPGWAFGPLVALALGLMPAHAVQAAPPAVQCMQSSGVTACGFGCKASGGAVRCAQTKDGLCTIGSGQVVCWDPPTILHKVLHDRVPGPSCTTSNGQTACGYQCVANYDRVQCAQTPFGACQANEDVLGCADPPVRTLATYGDKTPQVTCLANYGKVACGYHCIANYGAVRCAESPEGSCHAEHETVSCWDPPSEANTVVYDPASELACMSALEGRTCGFRCLATSKHFACGTGRRDSCRVEGDTVTCAEPR